MDRKDWEDTSCVPNQFGSHPAGESTDTSQYVAAYMKLILVDVHE